MYNYKVFIHNDTAIKIPNSNNVIEQEYLTVDATVAERMQLHEELLF